MQSISPLPLPLVPIAMDAQRTPVKRIIKLGGAAITNKECFETLQHEVLATSCQQIAACAQDVLCDTVVVHGAGSYGHMQACQYKVAAGGDLATNTALRMGFTLTRQSVTKLNHLVVAELVRTGLPACGMSLCGYWFTDNRQVAHADVAAVASLLSSGLLPVLHGDAVLDSSLGCTILSGDTIIRHLAEQIRPQFVVFLTNVEGVYDRPPEQSGAQLLRIIDVHQDGSWEAAGGSCSVQLSCSEHDTTGGIAKKVEEAAVIARLGIPVVIAKAGSEAARLACSEGPAAFLCAAAAGAGGAGDVGVGVAPPATVVRLV